MGTVKFSEYNIIDNFLADVKLITTPETGRVRGILGGYIDMCISVIPNDWLHSYGVIVHELGHYKFDLGDEYEGKDGEATYCRTHMNNSIMDVPFHYSIPRGTSEFCTSAGPNSQHDPRSWATQLPAFTEHDAIWSSLGNYTSCWTVINKYNNSIRIPTGDPDPGPCSKSDDPTSRASHEPLESHQGVSQFVVLIGP